MRLTHLLPIAVLGLSVLWGCADDDEPKAVPDETASSSTPSEVVDTNGDVPAFCAAYEVLSEVDPAARNPAKLEQNLVEFTAATVAAAASAPAEIKDAAQLLADRFPDYVASAEAADYRPTQAEVLAFFNAEDVSEAGGQLDVFAEANCDS
jgi:hypothetical protein